MDSGSPPTKSDPLAFGIGRTTVVCRMHDLAVLVLTRGNAVDSSWECRASLALPEDSGHVKPKMVSLLWIDASARHLVVCYQHHGIMLSRPQILFICVNPK